MDITLCDDRIWSLSCTDEIFSALKVCHEVCVWNLANHVLFTSFDCQFMRVDALAILQLVRYLQLCWLLTLDFLPWYAIRKLKGSVMKKCRERKFRDRNSLHLADITKSLHIYIMYNSEYCAHLFACVRRCACLNILG